MRKHSLPIMPFPGVPVPLQLSLASQKGQGSKPTVRQYRLPSPTPSPTLFLDVLLRCVGKAKTYVYVSVVHRESVGGTRP